MPITVNQIIIDPCQRFGFFVIIEFMLAVQQFWETAAIGTEEKTHPNEPNFVHQTNFEPN
jgi:hypothetical protein